MKKHINILLLSAILAGVVAFTGVSPAKAKVNQSLLPLLDLLSSLPDNVEITFREGNGICEVEAKTIGENAETVAQEILEWEVGFETLDYGIPNQTLVHASFNEPCPPPPNGAIVSENGKIAVFTAGSIPDWEGDLPFSLKGTIPIWELYGNTPQATDIRLATQAGDCHTSVSFSGPAAFAEKLAEIGFKRIAMPGDSGAFGMMGVTKGECPEPPDDFPTGGVAVVFDLSLMDEKIYEHNKSQSSSHEETGDLGWIPVLALLLLLAAFVFGVVIFIMNTPRRRNAIQT